MMRLQAVWLLWVLSLNVAFTVTIHRHGHDHDNNDNDNDNDNDNEDSIIVGIDLGTTYSCVAVYKEGGTIEIIPNDQGNRITPSYVAFLPNGERLVGDAAKHQATLNPQSTIFDVKRFLGREYNDPSVQADAQLLPYHITSRNGRPVIQIPYGDINHHGDDQGNAMENQDGHETVQDVGATTTRWLAPEEISAMVLQKLKQTAETYLGQTVSRAVITVPAYFHDAQRQATHTAATIAGWTVVRMLNEPTAAAMAYGLQHYFTVVNSDNQQHSNAPKEEQNVLVFDLGGGTLDVTVLTVDEGVFQVLATSGDTHLGGSDFDQTIMTYYLDKIEEKSKQSAQPPPYYKNIRQDARALQKLRTEAERVKRALSTALQATLEVEDIIPGLDIRETMTRAKFEELNHALFQKALRPVQQALQDADLERDDIQVVLLVGGSTRIPKIRQLLADYFGGEEKLYKGSVVNPDEAVAYGAALQASILSGRADRDGLGQDIMLLDVTPLSLGTSIQGGLMSVLIKRGTTIPTEKSEIYHTLHDNQQVMTIDVYEGERSYVEDNHFLGEFDMVDLPPGPAESVQVKVTFTFDANGMLQVAAETMSTKQRKQLVIQTHDENRLSQQDIDRMVQDATRYAQQDQQAVKRMQARNRLESFAYALSNTLSEHSDSAEGHKNDDASDRLSRAIAETLEWLDTHAEAKEEELDKHTAQLEALAGPLLERWNEDFHHDNDDEL